MTNQILGILMIWLGGMMMGTGATLLTQRLLSLFGNFFVRGSLQDAYWRFLFGTLILGVLLISGCLIISWMMGGGE